MMKKKTFQLDNSWIRKDVEAEPVDDDPTYGRDVLGNTKTRTGTESKPADTKQSNTANLNTSVNSVTKRFNESQSFPNKNTTPTATKPPVPDKKTQSNRFTARVFSGASSNEKVLSPVKKSTDEKFPDPPKEVTDGYDSNESKIKITTPSTTTVTSVRKYTETYTTPEKNYPSFTSKTETYSRTLEQSNPLNSLSDDLIPTLSPNVQTKPTSPLKSPLDMSYNTYQQVKTTEVTVGPSVQLSPQISQSLRSPVTPTPVPSTTTRVIGKRDLCSFCAKSIIERERIIMDDLQIFSHTFCFKCDMCYQALGNLAAGDSLWVHRGRVTCEKCYVKTKGQWYR